MKRSEAEKVLYDIIGSGIISEDLEEKLGDIADAIVYDEFEDDGASGRDMMPMDEGYSDEERDIW